MEFSLVPDYFYTSIYTEVEASVRHDLVTVLHGLSGSGKTQICARLTLKYRRNRANNVFIYKAKTLDSLTAGIDAFFNERNLTLNRESQKLLPQFLDALNSSVSGESHTVVILDDIEDETITEEVLKDLDFAGEQGHLTNITVIVTTQIRPHKMFSANKRFLIKQIDGFSKEDAMKYLKIPENRLEDVLKSISCLPVALNLFKQDYHSDRLESDDAYIDKYLHLMAERKDKNKALRCIQICLGRAISENLLYENVLKYLSLLCEDNISIELLEVLVEEVDNLLDFEEANEIVEVLVKRSIGSLHESDTQKRYLSLHSLVKEAVDALVKDEDRPEMLRIALRAFCRIMPRDGRHHQSDVVPKMLQHALSLRKSYKKITKSHPADELTKLLFAELHTSIGYCMMSYGHNAENAIRCLEDGNKLFLRLLFQGNYSSDNFENAINDSLQHENSRQRFMQNNEQYTLYIESLFLRYRPSYRDLKTLFSGATDEDLRSFKKSDHLSTSGVDYLRKKHDVFLLSSDKLALLYPLELFTQHLHLLAKCYVNLNKDESVMIAEKTDAIYNSIKNYCGVTLLAMFINKRFLLNLQTEMPGSQALDSLCTSWRELRESSSGMAYECGIVRSMEMSKDDYHQLICLEGEMLVYGAMASKTSDPERKKQLVIEGEKLVAKIEALCSSHHKPHVTYSRAYIEVSKFYHYSAEFEKAVSYSLRSMMEYKEDWLGKLRINEGHPELDDDKINKFSIIYNQLDRCLKSFKDNNKDRKLQLFPAEIKYVEEVNLAWQKRSNSNQEGQDLAFEALIELQKLTYTEPVITQPTL